MAEPDRQTIPLTYNNNEPLDTSTPDPSFLESMITSTLDQVKEWIDATNPGSVRLAGMYYTAAESLLNGFAGDLKAKSTELADHYKGPVAVETQKQLRSLHASARELAQKLGAVGRVLTDYAETLTWAQANVVESPGRDSRSDNDIDWAGQIPFYRLHRGDQRAVDHLKEVNERIVGHYQQLPTEVQQALPDPNVIPIPNFDDGGGRIPTMPNVGGNPGLGGYQGASFDPGSIPGGLPDTPGAGDGSYPSGQYPTGSGPGGPNAGGLDGSNPYAAGDPSGLTDTTLGATPGPSAGTPGNYGTTNLAGYDPSLGAPNGGNTTTTGGPGMGPGTSAGSGGGAGAGAAVAAGRAGANGMGFPIVPAAGGTRGGGEETGRESTTWLAEDDDVWGGPEGTTPSTLA
ncbi:hypothetical protein ACFLIM_09535 [Nonomuraea sp. M3C6]|uniref:PPE family protein n=1 Tax=Nonomuraea marmarensis TaxID=3351344 RepID=A0ABW7AAU2_9ACTN